MSFDLIIPHYGYRVDLKNMASHFARDVLIFAAVVGVFMLIEGTVFRIPRIYYFLIANFATMAFSIGFEFGNGVSFKHDGNRGFFDPFDCLLTVFAFLPVTIGFFVFDPSPLLISFVEFSLLANVTIFFYLNVLLVIANKLLKRPLDILNKE